LAVLIDPYAGPPSRTASAGWGENRPKVRALLGGRDAVVGAVLPKRALKRLTADGLDVTTVLIPDATHCFDDENASDPRTHYREDLSAEAQAFYAAALREM
ncbi:MAG: dienelactone hydrolase family protein, partial [Caulobacteraceae bacterium]